MGSDGAAGSEVGQARQAGNPKAGWILFGAAIVLAAGSIGYSVYSDTGSLPADSQATEVEPSIEQLRAAAEASTGDAGLWSELGFAHFQRGEFAAAADAYQRATRIDPQEAVLWSALGEALVMASQRDPLPPPALRAFNIAIELDPDDPRARYFLAVKQDLDDDHTGAIAAWLDLLADSPPGAPWESDLIRTIQQVGAIHEIEVETRLAAAMDGRMPAILAPGSGSAAGAAASPDLPGPSAAHLVAAGGIPPGAQRAMAEDMVARLETRLAREPQNLDGWVMLMRSRMTLDEPAKARAALAAAVNANPREAGQLRRQAEMLGIR